LGKRVLVVDDGGGAKRGDAERVAAVGQPRQDARAPQHHAAHSNHQDYRK
jgi:hypothetical protein